MESSATIRDHLDSICNYFISRSSSSAMEGVNHRLKPSK
ncbi:MAG: transposase [Symplocastrum torsivum CPER-KK1]|uniref:Transposase n=1 Tax=Symplocastrum torsivum CPER-KK1 TaxID=450513 RepID=A0A951PUC9_9CYAN|nr:transposase [Symplocastrum torsivum CPER-KK1]